MASLIERNGVYYITDRLSGKIVRHSLRTDSLQIAKEKLRQYQSAQLRGDDIPLPTRTPIAQHEHLRAAFLRRAAARSHDHAQRNRFTNGTSAHNLLKNFLHKLIFTSEPAFDNAVPLLAQLDLPKPGRTIRI